MMILLIKILISIYLIPYTYTSKNKYKFKESIFCFCISFTRLLFYKHLNCILITLNNRFIGIVFEHLMKWLGYSFGSIFKIF